MLLRDLDVVLAYAVPKEGPKVYWPITGWDLLGP